MARLSREEKAILDAYEAETLEPVKDQDALLKQHQASAEATFRKDARINIRITNRDLKNLQRKACEEGIPYQTLIASVLHKYVEGRLQETP